MIKPVPTTPENLVRINMFFEVVLPLLLDLHARWLDEREYEDINDYAVPLRKKLPQGFTLTKMTKRPFGFEFTIGTAAVYAITTTTKTAKWKRIK